MRLPWVIWCVSQKVAKSFGFSLKTLSSVKSINMYQSFYHKVTDDHQLAVTFAGNPAGIPVLFLHGGPGAGCKLSHCDYFDLSRYWVVLFDQRGSGRSLPYGALEHNSSSDLIQDIESLRRLFGVQQWLLFGGSWGSYLALAYAIHYPHHVSGMVLRSICLGRLEEHDWLYYRGASELFPDAWQAFTAFIPEAEHAALLAAYYQRLMSDDIAIAWPAAWHWSRWAMACLELPLPIAMPEDWAIRRQWLLQARIEAHYYYHQLFFPVNFVQINLPKLQNIPIQIVHGQYDFLCPVANAVILQRHLPHSQLTIVPKAGHLSAAPGMFDALIAALVALAPSHYSQ